MAWTTPMTFVSGAVLTAAQLNTHLRDNLNETAPGKATTAGRIFVATGTNAIAERAIDQAFLSSSQSTTSETYTDLATVGPQVTITTGTHALVFAQSRCRNSTGGAHAVISHAVSGASTIGPEDVGQSAWYESSNADDDASIAYTWLHEGDLTAGSNTFTMKYRRTSSGGTAGFSNRKLIVMAL